ncbi:VTC domain-domain-containing protein [Syncephalastrum racemosum]|uniref:Vacuolar transporter chaperone complex subunit 4 n=1 Tax=Syncephalastrum racemosum TaxID=13706 RepID=A0A1X2H7E4_SYNRA|nr:VTC domain-domain-containing protein [Syncephalastrum racemosum]
MKFGNTLKEEKFAPWENAYIHYDLLKNELKTRQLDHTWNDKDEEEFMQLLCNELDNVYAFLTAKLTELEAQINYCERSVRALSTNMSTTSESWQGMDDFLTELLFDVNDLSKFTRLNYTGFQKIVKKHDKWTARNLFQRFLPVLRAKPLDNQRFDVAIVFLSALHDVCQRQGVPRTGNAAAGGDQNAFERATAKYWIHPDNITEVKALIMLHLPVLIFNKEKEFEPDDTAVSSVYWDNEDFDLYTGRLQRDVGAEAIRFRWYGKNDTKSIFIERKTHRAPWLNGVSIKDRFMIKEDEVDAFVRGELTADMLADRLRESGQDEETVNERHFIASGIQQSLKEKNLQPMIRVFYNRTAFQLPGDQRVRISLDTNLTFIREDNLDGEQRRDPAHWRRTDLSWPFTDTNQADVLRFPYAVLETKIQTHLGQEPPQWLDKLLKSHLVHEVPKFSKFLHGASNLYADRIPLLPWWLSEMGQDIRRPRAHNFGLSRSRSYKPMIDGQYSRAMKTEERRMDVVAEAVHRSTSQQDIGATLVAKGDAPRDYGSPPLAHRKPYDDRGSLGSRVKVDEGDIIIDVEDREIKQAFVSRIAGGIFIGISAVVAIYALYRFEKRAWMINRRVLGRYDDLWGPFVLCCLLVAALIVNFYLRFR